MPRTTKISSPSLQIDVASPSSWTFTPGDTVIGTVVSQSAIVAPEATVTVTLFGRVKTKITVRKSDGNGGTTTEHYRGRWLLVGSETTQVLHQGPLHLAAGSGDCLSWPFSITIPTRPVNSLVRQSDGAKSFLPLDNIADHPLPGSFYSYGGRGNKKSEAFVEYYLESVLRYSRGSSHKSHTATFPLNLQHPPAPISSGSVFQRSTFQQTVQTQRLLPEMKDAELTFKQKTQKFFHSSKVPTFGYNIEVSSPRVIQLEDPSPIPLIIRFSPNTVLTSPSIHDTKQIIRLNWVQMSLESKTSVIAPGRWKSTKIHDHQHSSERDFGLQCVFSSLENPIVFESAEGSQEVDVGKVLQLVLHPTGLRAGNRPPDAGPTVYPDFVTYNIKLEHSIKWQFSFTVADETNKTKTTTPVKIVPPIRNDSNPPEYSKKG